MKTNKELKVLCIKYLKLLISDIENDNVSDNYYFGWDLLEQREYDGIVERTVRYSLTRSEYIKKQ